MTTVPVGLLDVFREEADERLGEISECLLAIEAGNPPADAIDTLFRQAHSLKGAASMVGFNEAAAIAHAIEDVLEPARAEGALAPELVDSLLRATDDLRRAVSKQPAAAPTSGDTSDPTNGGASIPTNGGTSVPPNGGASASPAGPTSSTSEPSASAPAPTSRPSSSVRLATEKVDRMLDTVGEAVIQHRRLEHLIGPREIEDDEDLKEEIDREERLLGELQDAALEMRMVPLSFITGRFPRAVRDLALSEGKEVDLQISGVDTQLDRVLLDGLADAITHLLRNAIAHGIEPPEARERAGKSRVARLTLHAEPRGDLVAIEVGDDGRGVSAELSDEAARRGSLVDVLAKAGFSTATTSPHSRDAVSDSTRSSATASRSEAGSRWRVRPVRACARRFCSR